MKLSELYSEYFANWLSGGALINKDKISLIGIKPFFDRFMTNKFITKVWLIEAFPVYFENNICHEIRTEMHNKFPSVRTIIHVCSTPCSISVKSEAFNRMFKTSSKRYNEYNEAYESLNKDDQLTGFSAYVPGSARKITITKDTLERYKQDYDSYRYVYESVASGESFTHSFIFIQASASDKKTLAMYSKALDNLMTSEGIVCAEVQGTISNYLHQFAPASILNTNDSRFVPTLLSEDNLSAILPNKTQGLIGHGPLLVGIDWMSKLPFWIDFFSSGSAQVIMILARTGYGKTFIAFTIAIGLTGLGVHWSAIDIKGNEWIKVGKYVDVAVIAMSGSDARFVNTLRLDDIECDESDCQDFFDTAVRGTCDLFEIATNLSEREGNVTDLRAILDAAVSKVYSSRGIVRENPSTFALSKDLTFADVLDVISTLESTRSYSDSQRNICKLIKVRTSAFFLGEGRYSYAFKNELTVGEVLNTPGVIYDFNKNSGEALGTLDSLRVFMVQFLDGKKHSIRRRKKLHTAAFYEELQRSSSFGKLVDAISQNVTGSRSNNLTVFLLLNAVSTFKQDGFAPIKSNITTKIIGKVIDEDIGTLVNQFDCGMIEDYMKAINNDDKNEYQHCFAIQYDTGDEVNKAMVRSIVPPDMVTSLRTRTAMEE